eukprot:m.108647 g.108647  ORF g.108647 m.108647 type:complete len:443 (+) comp13352_c0_seq1:163-1491(+)
MSETTTEGAAHEGGAAYGQGEQVYAEYRGHLYDAKVLKVAWTASGYRYYLKYRGFGKRGNQWQYESELYPYTPGNEQMKLERRQKQKEIDEEKKLEKMVKKPRGGKRRTSSSSSSVSHSPSLNPIDGVSDAQVRTPHMSWGTGDEEQAQTLAKRKKKAGTSAASFFSTVATAKTSRSGKAAKVRTGGSRLQTPPSRASITVGTLMQRYLVMPEDLVKCVVEQCVRIDQEHEVGYLTLLGSPFCACCTEQLYVASFECMSPLKDALQLSTSDLVHVWVDTFLFERQPIPKLFCVQLVSLPRNPCVRQFLEDFLARPQHQEMSSDEQWWEKTLVSNLHLVFDAALGHRLLFTVERAQYFQVLQTAKEGQVLSMSDFYGAEHLLRLLAQYPDLLRLTKQAKVEVEHGYMLQSLVQFLHENSAKYISLAFERAPPEYMRLCEFSGL